MIDLIQSLYADDSLRFGLWTLITSMGYAGKVRLILHRLGVDLFEDYTRKG